MVTRAASVGMPIGISRSKRPARLKAESSASGRFVAPGKRGKLPNEDCTTKYVSSMTHSTPSPHLAAAFKADFQNISSNFVD